MTRVAQWVQDLVPATKLHVGAIVQHPDGRTVKIVGGYYWGEHGLSNHWRWKAVLPSGRLSRKVESGYGWM